MKGVLIVTNNIKKALEEVKQEGYTIHSITPRNNGSYYSCEATNSTGYNTIYIYADGQWHYDW